MKRIQAVPLAISLLLPLLTGAVSAALSARGMAIYGSMNKPPLSPPAWVFSVAWTMLYLIMGLASYYVLISDALQYTKATALCLYVIQLAMNFLWSIIFFNWNMYLVAFIWLMVMWVIVIFTAYRFYLIDHKSGYLMIPYILWLTFAAYLNIGAYVLDVS